LLRSEIDNTYRHWSNTVTPISSICELDCEPSTGQHTVESTASEVFDLEALHTRCMGNLDFVQRVLEKFEQRVPEELAELERLVALNDGEEVARVAHRLKGTSANVSADGLCQAAAEIEDLGRTGRVADVPGGIEHLRGEWKKYLNCVSTLFATINTKRHTEQLPASGQS
jgi:HPt (histidine-containing phosphotransfer) domain-containing protein